MRIGSVLAALISCVGVVANAFSAERVRLDRVWLVGHRGAGSASSSSPEGYHENTAAAVSLGFQRQADLVEVDVQLDARGEVVLWHDKEIPLPGGKRRVRDVDASQLRAARLKDPTLPPLDRLKDALLAAAQIAQEAGPPVMDIELKIYSDADRVPLVEAVASLLEAEGLSARVMFSSFDWKVLVELETRLPGAQTGLLTVRMGRGLKRVLELEAERNTYVEWVLGRGPTFGTSRLKKKVAEVHAAGRRAGVWTVNKRRSLLVCRRAQVDMVITDHPERAAEIFRDGVSEAYGE